MRSLKFKFFRWGAKFLESKAAALLAPLGWIWEAVASFRHFLYDHRLLPSYQVNVPVVSVGNLAVGGTGKTPLVIMLAEQFAHRRVAILLRGYGNDEELVLRRHLPFAAIYVGPDRVKSAQRAVQEGAEILFLDDGFQHRRLRRNFDLVIIRGAGRCLPAGELREGPRGLRRAHTIFGPGGIPLEVAVRRIISLRGEEVSTLAGVRVGMFTGIGHPERFKQKLEQMGAQIVAELFLADHEPIGMKRLLAFYDQCKKLNVKYLVCTEKDAVKLPPVDLPIVFLEIKAIVPQSCESWRKLIAEIEGKML